MVHDRRTIYLSWLCRRVPTVSCVPLRAIVGCTGAVPTSGVVVPSCSAGAGRRTCGWVLATDQADRTATLTRRRA